MPVISFRQNIIPMIHKKNCNTGEINVENSERRTVNIICSLDLQYCLYAKNQERNTRGMLLGFVLHLARKKRVVVVTAISLSTLSLLCLCVYKPWQEIAPFSSQITPSSGASHEEIK